MVLNYNFLSGTDSWSATNSSGSVTDGILTCTATAAQGYYRQKLPIIKGHKYYIKSRVKADSNQVKLYLDARYYPHAGTNNYQVISAVLEAYNTGNIGFGVRDYRSSDWTPFYIDYSMAWDLTATFGEGREPGIEWCNAHLTLDNPKCI